MVARNPGGVLAASTAMDVELLPLEKTVIVNVHSDIPKGWLTFTLNDFTTPIGLAAGVFEISTSDYGLPDRLYDTAVHALVNPVDLEMWWNGDAHATVVTVDSSSAVAQEDVAIPPPSCVT